MSEREVAIALGYDSELGDAPKVLAAGYGHIARQIMAIASKEGIHIHQDDNLAQILAQVPVGYEIPETAYQLVAEILAFLYQTDRALKEKISK
ncbi:flagellar biosynthesis protein [Mariprofundus ferrinatatus]|uniref:Flagellar biosynthesis protein n=1 Tax=Mariprofundus ferrinatatus TaxID=1921087 RepID=A0A2K8L737_9PROT|nr:EscU/YscU/HrcU family type III secretion system export apparatus switch protein [Mariprofundus ferrinatatus]ATX82942.1 flagellar biosynthesis protein [Mariprofundus ferrinatatus]